MVPEFINMFDLLGNLLAKKSKLAALAPQARAVLTVVGLAVVTVGLGAASVFTRYSFIPLLTLGAFYGVVLSYPLTKFFAPRVQSLVTGFLGGVTLGNIGSQEAKLRSWIIGLGKWIKQLVTAANPPERLSDAIVYSIWTAIVIALAVLAANAYFANQATNPVGNPVPRAGPQTLDRDSGQQLAQKV